MIAKAAPLDKQYAASQPHFRTGVFGGKHWAIRKDDFTLIEIVAATAIAAAAFATTVAASPAALTVTLLFAVLKVADQLRRKGASLYDKQCEIIVI